MNYFLKKRKWMAWLVLLTFLFTSFMPTNLLAGNSIAEAATTSLDQISNDTDHAETKYYKGTGTGTDAVAGNGTKSDYQASTSKTITQVGENEFDITLQVLTTET